MSFNLTKRQSTGKPPSNQTESRAPVALLKALMDTGRTKGSSATPVLQPAVPVLSPNPNRAFQAQIDKTNNASHPQEAQSQDVGVADAHYGSSTQHASGHNRNMSTTTQQSFQTGGYASRNPTPAVGPSQFRPGESRGPGQASDEPMTAARLGQAIYDGLNAIVVLIHHCNGMNPDVQAHLTNAIQRLDHELSSAQRLLQFEIDREVSTRTALYKQVEYLQDQLKFAHSDRDHFCMERDQLQRSLDAIRKQDNKISEKWERAEQNWRQEMEDLRKQVSIQDEQLKGKRALWLESNPGSSARREAMNATLRDPFNSPSTHQEALFDSGYLGGHGSSAPSSFRSPPRNSYAQVTTNLAPIGAPRGPRRRGNLPTGSALPARVVPQTTYKDGSSFQARTEHGGSTVDPQESMALVPYSGEADAAPRFKAEFTHIYELIEGWVKSYANLPNLANDQKIARSNNVLWDFMMNCAYPGHRQDSHTHVMTLLNDPNARCWFVMRMAITYLIKELLTLGAFRHFSPASDAEFADVKKKLQELRGAATESRQKLVDQQARAVQSIVASHNYQDFRSTEISVHSKKLRDMLGPLLNPGCVRGEAGRDLGAIVIKAWELSVKIYTSHLTFQICFPETNAKFMAATMIAKDQPNVDAMQLQIKQTRLKLVITPVITMRDDRGTTIKAKNLHLSTVLTMV